MSKLVLGVFLNRTDAEDAIKELEADDYNPKDISIVMKNHEGEVVSVDDSGAEVAAGAVSGATTGGVLGALAGLLVGTGVLPGIGMLLIGGPLAAALGLTGAAAATLSGAVTGALAGSLVGVLAQLGISKEDAMIYEDRIKEGGILVAVPARSGHEAIVNEILEEYGADQIRTINTEESVQSSQTGDSDYIDRSSEYPMTGAVANEIRRERRRK